MGGSLTSLHVVGVCFFSVSAEQIKNLHTRFQQLSGNEETISRESLENISALSNNPIRKQIIEAFFDKRNQHQNEVGTFQEISFEQFLMVMSHFQPPTLKTTEEEKEAMRKEKLRLTSIVSKRHTKRRSLEIPENHLISFFV
uniref:Tescalcin a n=1 Tax=Stegastes partitus TaxID=144197 RepID=A0A3B5AKJ5_9TELE